MSLGYVKLFGSIIHSTIWLEPDHVRLVWVTMLAMSSRDGEVEASVPGLATAARVSLEQCQDALVKLSAPDQHSRSKEFDGRRIEEIDGGWLVLNHDKYRKRLSRDEKRERDAERQRRHRARNSAALPDVTDRDKRDSHAASREVAHAEAEAEADQNNISVPTEPRQVSPDAAERPGVKFVFEAWKQETGKHRAKLDPKRRARIAARLKDFSPEQLVTAIAQRRNDPFLMGQNDSGRVYDDILTLLRDTPQVERLLALTAPARPVRRSGQREPQNSGTDPFGESI